MARRAAPAKKTVAKQTAPSKQAAAKAAPPTPSPAKKAAARTAPAPAPAQTPAEAAAATAAATKPSTGRKKASAKAPETVVRTPQSNVPAARKAPGPTTSSAEPRALVVRADEDPWTKGELTEVRNELRAEVARLRDELDMAEHEIDDMLRDSGDGAGDDAADAGSKTFEREHEMSLANNTRDMLVQAERALARIDNRTYGSLRELWQPHRQGPPAGVPAGHAVHDVQAAGGAPLSQGDQPSRGRPRLPLLLGVAGLVLAGDLVTKWLAVRELADREPVDLLGGLLTLRLVRNAGAAFGVAQGLTIAFTVVAAAVVVVILRLSRRLRSLPWAVALGLVLGGAVGNLVDRVFRAPGPGRGHVVDFLELPHWPVFNLADSAIVCAGVLMVLLSARGLGYDGSRSGS